MSKKTKLTLFCAVLTFTLAVFGAFAAMEEARTVVVLTVFFGAFGAGATLISAIHELRREQQARQQKTKV